MTTHTSSTEIHTRLKNFTTKDIKNLVQQQGNLKERDILFVLKDPSPTDATLLSTINDPYFEIKSIGDQHKEGEMYFDLKSNTRHVRIKIQCQVQKY